MTPAEIRDHLADMNPDAVLFEGPDYADALIGVTQDCRAVYDQEKCIAHLIAQDGGTYEGAVEFFEFNTVRALAYMGEHAPVIVRVMTEE